MSVGERRVAGEASPSIVGSRWTRRPEVQPRSTQRQTSEDEEQIESAGRPRMEASRRPMDPRRARKSEGETCHWRCQPVTVHGGVEADAAPEVRPRSAQWQISQAGRTPHPGRMGTKAVGAVLSIGPAESPGLRRRR